MIYPTAGQLPREQRPRHAQCPSCRAAVRVGWRDGTRVIGQHRRPTHPGPTTDGEHGTCCSCPGSYTPVTETDCWDFLQDAAVTATGSLTVVAATTTNPTANLRPRSSARGRSPR